MSDSRKTRNRKRLAQKIEIREIKIFFYDYYFFHNLICRVFPEFKYYKNYVRLNRADCDVIKINFAAFAKIDKKRARLRFEQYFIKLAENTAKIVINVVYAKCRRFEKLEKFLNARENELIRCDVKIIKELKKLKKLERLLKKRADANTVATFEPIGANFFSFSGD